MIIHYATVFDASNIHVWSGLGYYIGKTLENDGHTVKYLNDLTITNPLVTKLRKHLSKKIFGKTHSPNFDIKISLEYARLIEKRVPEGSLIFSPNTVILSNLNNSYKKVLYTDATFQRLLDFYPAFTNIRPGDADQAQAIERKALQNCDLLIYSSQWAADSAIRDYNANPDKVAVIPFGANLDVQIEPQELLPIVDQRLGRKEVHFVLVGISWFRKGVDYAIEVTKYMNDAGIETILHLVGLRQIRDLDTKKIVNHGFISKTTLEGQHKLANILKQSHFLLLPSRADCTPVVVSEANSFGLPCLVSNVGGNHNIVSDDVNGKLFDFRNGPRECAEFIISLLQSPEKYRQLCQSSYNRYLTELNWQNGGRKITELLKSL